MRCIRVFCLLFLLVLINSSSAFAQDTRKVGLAMGFPASVGFLFHVSERVALRPEISFSWSSFESDPESELGEVLTASTSDTSLTSIGVSALIYVARWESLRAYVAPRFGYSFGSSESEITITTPPGFFNPLPPLDTERETTTSAVSFGGSFGAQYWLGDRFALFGEVGLNYSFGTTETELGPVELETRTKAAGTRGAAGVVFYF